MLGDVLNYTVGYQVPHWESPAYPPATVGRRDRESRNFQIAYVLSRQSGNGEGVAGPGDGYEMRERPQFTGVFPAQNRCNRVGSRDEEEVGIWIRRPNVTQCIDGERG